MESFYKIFGNFTVYGTFHMGNNSFTDNGTRTAMNRLQGRWEYSLRNKTPFKFSGLSNGELGS